MQSLQANVQRIIDPNISKTFRPKRRVMAGSRLDRLNTLAQRTLGTGNLRAAVTLPPGEDLNEWLAVKTVDLFNEANLVYGFVGDYCASPTARRIARPCRSTGHPMLQAPRRPAR
jgi:MOB kinase activator 1